MIMYNNLWAKNGVPFISKGISKISYKNGIKDIDFGGNKFWRA